MIAAVTRKGLIIAPASALMGVSMLACAFAQIKKGSAAAYRLKEQVRYLDDLTRRGRP
jgi:hypothetical protein